MDIQVAPGKYVVAVSGGVDSMVLLHILSRLPGVRLTVAHFDHGIRPDSAKDRELVQATAKKLGLPFVYAEGHLGPGASEALARRARYDFLYKVLLASGGRAIVTAHHQDDVLETSILNLLRGTGRKGLSSLRERSLLTRPLLGLPKAELIKYAQDQGLVWHEDSTNQDTTYLRNYIRYKILSRFGAEQRQALWRLIKEAEQTNHELDALLANQLHLQSRSGQLDREWFNNLPHAVALEVMAAWLRANGLGLFDRRTLERLVVGAKTAAPSRRLDVFGGNIIEAGEDYLALIGLER